MSYGYEIYHELCFGVFHEVWFLEISRNYTLEIVSQSCSTIIFVQMLLFFTTEIIQ